MIPGAFQIPLGLGRLFSRGPSSSCSPFPLGSESPSPGKPPEAGGHPEPHYGHKTPVQEAGPGRMSEQRNDGS